MMLADRHYHRIALGAAQKLEQRVPPKRLDLREANDLSIMFYCDAEDPNDHGDLSTYHDNLPPVDPDAGTYSASEEESSEDEAPANKPAASTQDSTSKAPAAQVFAQRSPSPEDTTVDDRYIATAYSDLTWRTKIFTGDTYPKTMHAAIQLHSHFFANKITLAQEVEKYRRAKAAHKGPGPFNSYENPGNGGITLLHEFQHIHRMLGTTVRRWLLSLHLRHGLTSFLCFTGPIWHSRRSCVWSLAVYRD